MKIYLAQINLIVGDLDYNVRRVKESLAAAKSAGAELAVFPELTLIGYPPRDLLLHEDFIERNLDALKEVAAATEDAPACVVGYADKNAGPGKAIFNAAALCAEGRVLSRHYKSLLPTYDIFDEARYFQPAATVAPVEFKGVRLGITICEDVWNCERLNEKARPLYDRDPVAELKQSGLDLLINISASPYTLGKRELRENVSKKAVERAGVPLVHVNLVGGNDSIIFDGWSAALGADGRVLARTKDFKDDAVLFDTESMTGELRDQTPTSMARLLEALKLGLSDYVRKCGFQKCVLGLSGGIDSALVAALATFALGPENVVAVSMPSRFSSEGSQTDAEKLAERLGIEYREIPIEGPFASFLDLMEPHFEGRPFDVAEENIQARVRGIILMALSNKFGWLVLSTGNKSELAVGYCTLYGDMTGGLAVISDVPKTKVYELCRYINRDEEIIPRSIMEKPPSAELRPDQKDADALPPYEKLDPVIREYVERRKGVDRIVRELGCEASFARKILYMIYKNEYKRQQAAPGLKVTGRAFGEGWRMPIASAWWKKQS